MERHARSRPGSPCGDETSAEIMGIYSNLSYDAIVIKNHLKAVYNEDAVERIEKDYEDAIIAANALGMKALCGVEVTFTGTEGDYLIYGVEPRT